MHHYVRGKTWISNQLSEDILKAGTKDNERINFNYHEREKDLWKADRRSYIEYRKSLEFRLQGQYEITRPDSLRHMTARANYEKNMRERLKMKPEIIEKLIPDFPPLCKRLTPGPGYLEALTASHVELITQPIAHIDAEGITTSDGVRRPVDAIICATGFDTSPGQGFPLYGRDGGNLREKYAARPMTYLSLYTDNFPNFFQFLGPHAFQGAGNLLIMMEAIHKYMAKILRRLAYGNVRTIEPKRKQVENFTNYCDEYFQDTVYNAECVSWYKTIVNNVSGEKTQRVTALWPDSSTHAVHALESIRWEDFNMETYDGNDFGWFGNGGTVGENGLNHVASLDGKEAAHTVEALTWYLNGTKYLHEPL